MAMTKICTLGGKNVSANVLTDPVKVKINQNFYPKILLNFFPGILGTSCSHDFIRYRRDWKCSLGVGGNFVVCVDFVLFLYLEGRSMDWKGK
jgi:hypothetical protein